MNALLAYFQFLRDIEDDLYAVQLQEEDIRRRINLGNNMHG